MFRRPPAFSSARRSRGFTLAEVLAAMLFMAIVIPVAMEAMSVSSRAGILGQRKTVAMRIAERVLDEAIVLDQVTNGSPNGTITEGDVAYPWTIRSDPWSEDGNMALVTARVSFDVRGQTYEVNVSTLYDPNAATPATTSTAAR